MAQINLKCTHKKPFKSLLTDFMAELMLVRVITVYTRNLTITNYRKIELRPASMDVSNKATFVSLGKGLAIKLLFI